MNDLTITKLILSALAYEAEAFDNDDEVDGGDLVQFFTGWRLQVREAMGSTPRLDVSGEALISRLTELVQDAMDNHIYDVSNGDEISPDCGYARAVAEGEAYLACIPPAFTPPPIGALEVIRDLVGAVTDLDRELEQMVGLAHPAFTDADGAVASARDEGDEASKRADLYCKAVDTGPAHLFVVVEGGSVQDVTCDRPDGIKVTVIDYDITDEDQAIYAIAYGNGDWKTGRADEFEISPEAAPTIRDVPIEEEGA